MSHLHVEERPQVMKIRHNLQLNIPQPGATPHTKLGRVMHHQANRLPPIPVPSLLLLQYSSCLQEGAESGTPHHIAPRQTSLLFYVFSGLPQQHQSPMKRTKTTDKKQTNRKRAELNHEASRLIQQMQVKANKVPPRDWRQKFLPSSSSCSHPNLFLLADHDDAAVTVWT